jgi:hypothetical protein
MQNVKNSSILETINLTDHTLNQEIIASHARAWRKEGCSSLYTSRMLVTVLLLTTAKLVTIVNISAIKV